MLVIDDAYIAKRKELQNKWFLKNQDAINFVDQLFGAIELYDDLIDKDKEIEPERIHSVFLSLFITLPTNDWFISNRANYIPVMLVALNAFLDANIIGSSEDKKLRNLAFHIRNFSTELQIQTAFLLGGYQHMREVSGEIREFFAFESFAEWEK